MAAMAAPDGEPKHGAGVPTPLPPRAFPRAVYRQPLGLRKASDLPPAVLTSHAHFRPDLISAWPSLRHFHALLRSTQHGRIDRAKDADWPRYRW